MRFVGRAHGGIVAVEYAPMTRSMGVRVRPPYPMMGAGICAFGTVDGVGAGLVECGLRLV